jgi:hypothetical protein
MKKKLEIIANKKNESREIVKKLIDFGVTETQKIDIMFFLSLTIEDNELMKLFTSFINKYKININNDSKDVIVKNKSKIIT